MVSCVAEHIGERRRTYAFETRLDAVLYLQYTPTGRTSTAASDYSAVKDADALRLYFCGTALATKALGQSFLPPHYLSLSQHFKSHGAGVVVTELLDKIGVCCSDKARWTAEQHVVQRWDDEGLISKDDNLAVSAAWDNCDTNATAKYESAVHNGNIAATINVCRTPGISACLAPEKDWKERRSVSFEDITNGLDCFYDSPPLKPAISLTSI